MVLISLLFGSIFIHFYSASSHRYETSLQWLASQIFCASRSFFIILRHTGILWSCHAVIKIFLMNDMFKFCLHQWGSSIPRLMDAYEQSFRNRLKENICPKCLLELYHYVICLVLRSFTAKWLSFFMLATVLKFKCRGGTNTENPCWVGYLLSGT